MSMLQVSIKCKRNGVRNASGVEAMNHSQSTEYWRDAEVQHNGVAHYQISGDKPVKDEGHRLGENLVVIVDKRILERECLARGLREHDSTLKISAVGSLDEFQKLPSSLRHQRSS
jgi:hypothetical protein